MYKTFFLSLLILLSFACTAQPDDYGQAMALGENAAANRQYAQAIQYFGQAIKIKPSSPEAYLKQMESAIQKRDLSIFKQTIQQLEGLEYPLILDIYITYAQLAKKKRLYKDGLAMLNKASLKNKNNKTILLHKAALYQKLNNTKEVLNLLQEVLKLEPKNLEVQHQLATIYININSNKSIGLFKKLLHEEHYKDSALSALGLLYSKKYDANPAQNRADLILALSYYNQYSKRHPKEQDIRILIENIRILLDS